MLIGNVGKEPVIRYIEGGICTASLTLATNAPGYTLPNGTVVPERTEWHNVLLWRKLAEVVEKYVHKGDKLYIEGELRTRNWTDKKGITHYITEIWAKEMEMLSPRAQNPQAETPAEAPQKTQENNAAAKDSEELPF